MSFKGMVVIAVVLVALLQTIYAKPCALGQTTCCTTVPTPCGQTTCCTTPGYCAPCSCVVPVVYTGKTTCCTTVPNVICGYGPGYCGQGLGYGYGSGYGSGYGCGCGCGYGCGCGCGCGCCCCPYK